ncbi:conserved domain protein [Candidatus Moduliflexus flocculans]|uniref:Conserved domain protein n=1 Tax=Candidatus Moduliflexus flocculans TaxID=1499966 RepID=A0A081BQF6_9BACT|nr:conserved domain protein [Candidatus Moduliflexus flocculans]
MKKRSFWKIVKKTALFLTLAFVILLTLATVGYYLFFAEMVDRWLTNMAQTTLTEQLQREVSVEQVHLSFPNPKIVVSNVAIARQQQLSEGVLLSAKTLQARLLLRNLLAGQIAIDNIFLDAPVIWVEFDEQGHSNLPTFDSKEPKEPSKFDANAIIKRLIFPDIRLRNGSIHFAHRQLQLAADIPDLNIAGSFKLSDFSGRGNISLENSIVEFQDRGKLAVGISGKFRYKNDAVTLSALTLKAGSSEITLDGKVVNFSKPELALSVAADVVLEEIDRYAKLDQNLRGKAHLTGDVTGTIPAVAANLHLSLKEGTAWRLAFANVETDAHYQDLRLMLSNLALDMWNGHVTGEGKLSFVGTPGYDAALDLANVELSQVNSILDAPIDIAGAVSGKIAVQSKTFAFEDLNLQAQLALQGNNFYGVPVASGALNIGIKDRTLLIDSLDANLFRGTLHANGTLALFDDFVYQVALNPGAIELADVMGILPDPPAVAGQLSGKISANGSHFDLPHLSAEADLDLTALDAYKVKAERLKLAATIRENIVHLTSLDAVMFGGNVKAAGELALSDFAYQAAVDLSAINLKDVGAIFPQPLAIAGQLNGNISAHASDFNLPHLTADAALELTGVEAYNVQSERLKLDATLRDNTVFLKSLDAAMFGGKILANGQLALFDIFAYQATVDLTTIDLAKVMNSLPNPPAVAGQLTGTVSANGSHFDLLHLTADASLNVADLDAYQIQAERLKLDATLRDNTVHLASLDAAAIFGGSIKAAGQLALSENFSYQATVNLDKIDLAAVMSIFPEPPAVVGQLTGTASASGSHFDLPHVTADAALELTNIDAYNVQSERLKVDATLRENVVHLTSFDAAMFGGKILANGQIALSEHFPYQAAVDLSEIDLANVMRIVPNPPAVVGKLSGKLSAQGSDFDLPHLTADAALELSDIDAYNVQAKQLKLDAAFRENTVYLSALDAAVFGGKIFASGQLALSGDFPYQATADLTAIDLKTVAGILPNLPAISGQLTGNVSAQGTNFDLPHLSADTALELTDIDAYNVRAERLEIDAAFHDNAVQLKTLHATAFGGKILASGQLALSQNFPYQATVELAAIDLATVMGVLPDPPAVAGLLNGKLSAQGTDFDLAYLTADAQLDVTDLNAYNAKTGRLTTRLSVKDNTVYLTAFDADIFQGKISASGQVGLTKDFPLQAQLNLSAIDLADVMKILPNPPAVTGQLSGSLTAQGSPLDLPHLVAEAQFDVTNVNAYDVQTGRLTTHLSVKENVANLTAFEADLFEGNISASGQMQLSDTFPYQAQINLNAINLAAVAGMLPNPPAMAGQLTGSVSASGSHFDLAHLQADAAFDLTNLDAYNVQSEKMTLKATAVDNVVHMTSFDADVFGGTIAATGELVLSENFPYQATVDLTTIDLANVTAILPNPPTVAGQLTGKISAQGSHFDLPHLNAEADLNIANLDAYNVAVNSLKTQAEFRDNTVFLKAFDADIFNGKVSASGNLTLSENFPYNANVTLAAIHLADVMQIIPDPPAVSGLLNGSVSAQGSHFDLQHLAADVKLNLTDLDAYDVQAKRIAATTQLCDGLVSLSDFTAELFDGSISGNGEFALADDRLPKFKAALDIRNISVGAILQQFAPQLAQQGLKMTASLSGKISTQGASFELQDIQADADMQSAGEMLVSKASAPVPLALRMKTGLRKQQAKLEVLSVDSSALRLDVTGGVNLNKGVTLDLVYQVASDNLNALMTQVAAFVPGMGNDSPLSKFSGDIQQIAGTARGAIPDVEITANAHLTNADFFWAQADDVALDAGFKNNIVTVNTARIAYKSAVIDASGTVDLAGKSGMTVNIPIRLSSGQLADYLGIGKQALPVSGELRQIDVLVQGAVNDLQADATLNIRKGNAYGQSFDELTGDMALAENRVTISSLQVKKNGGTIDLKGFYGFDQSFDVKLSVDNINFRDIDQLKSVAVQYTGRVDMTLAAHGTAQNPVAEGKIVLNSLTYNERPIEDIVCTISAKDQKASALLKTFREKLQVTFNLGLTPDLPYRAELSMQQAEIEQMISTVMEWKGVTGLITGKIASEGSLKNMQNISADVKLSELSLDVYGQKLKNSHPIDLVVTEKKLTVNSLDMRGDELGLYSQGFLDFQGNFNLDVDGIIDLRAIEPFIPDVAGILDLDGRAQVICSLHGTFKNPEIDGIFELGNVRIKHRAYPDPVWDVNGKIAISKDEIRIAGLTGKIGKGDFEISGSTSLDGLMPKEFSVKLKGNQIAVNGLIPELSFTVSPTVRFSGTLQQQKLAGEIVIHEALYTKELDLQEFIGNKNRKISLVLPGGNAAKPKETLTLDISVKALKDVRYKNKLADIEIRANPLRIMGSPLNPQIQGRVEALNGKILFGDIQYNIIGAVFDFIDPSRLNPEMNVNVQTVIQNYAITLLIQGNLDQFTLDMSSDPPLKDGEIARLLAIGMGDQMNASNFLIKPVQTVVEGRLEDIFKLDRISVDVDPLLSKGSSNASPTVTLMKKFFDVLAFSFTTTVGGTEREQLFKVEYDVSDNLAIEAQRNELGEMDSMFTFKFKLK